MADHSWTGVSLALAPNVVAVVVVAVTAWQNRWQRGFSERTHRVDVRELKLALYEKRLAVLKTITGVLARAYTDPGTHDDRNDQLFHCLLEGQTLFSPAIAARLEAAWLEQVEYHNKRMDYVAAARVPLPETASDREAKRLAAETLRKNLFDTVKRLHTDMISATRVDGIIDDEETVSL